MHKYSPYLIKISIAHIKFASRAIIIFSFIKIGTLSSYEMVRTNTRCEEIEGSVVRTSVDDAARLWVSSSIGIKVCMSYGSHDSGDSAICVNTFNVNSISKSKGISIVKP